MHLISEQDLIDANEELWGSEHPAAEYIDQQELLSFITAAFRANADREPPMEFPATMAWGISLGVLAGMKYQQYIYNVVENDD